MDRAFPGRRDRRRHDSELHAETKIVMSAMAPTCSRTCGNRRTTATWQFTAVDARSTRVTLKQTGWKEGDEWDKAYEYLADGNAQLLETLQSV